LAEVGIQSCLLCAEFGFGGLHGDYGISESPTSRKGSEKWGTPLVCSSGALSLVQNLVQALLAAEVAEGADVGQAEGEAE
jgi:hypothetical protein